MRRAFTFVEVLILAAIVLIIAALAEGAACSPSDNGPKPVEEQTLSLGGAMEGRIVVLPTGERVLIIATVDGTVNGCCLLPPLKEAKVEQ